MLTRKAIGNLINRYSAVLKKCVFINACAMGVVMTTVSVHGAYAAGTQPLTTAWGDKTLDEYTMEVDHTGRVSSNGLGRTFILNGGGNSIDGENKEYSGDYVLMLDGSDNLTLSNVTIENYKQQLNSYNGLHGAIHINSYKKGILTIKDNVIFQNNNFQHGTGVNNNGTLYIYGNNGSVKFLNNIAEDHEQSSGGAINNCYIAYIDGTLFQENVATYSGGAIENDGTLTVTNSTFEGNKAESGGAIHRLSGTANISNSTFRENKATEKGGAISNFYDSDGNTMTIQDSNFYGNTSDVEGGAIYNNFDPLKIIVTSNGDGVVFKDNKADGVPNAIHNEDGTVYLYAAKGKEITFWDGIVTNHGYYRGKVFIGGKDDNTTYDGTVIMNNIISGNGSVELNRGTFELGAYIDGDNSTNFTNTVNLALNGGIVNMQNDIAQRQTPASVSLGNDITMKLDVVLDNKNSEMDGFSLVDSNYTGTGHTINLDLKIRETSATDEKINVPFTEGGSFSSNTIVLSGKDITEGVYKGAVYEYDVAYIEAEETSADLINGNSYITFERESFNPETATSDVAATSLLIFHDEIYTRLFRAHNATKTRIDAKDEGAAFMSVFGGKEQLDLENFSHDINLKSAGTIVGYEGKSHDLGSDAEVFVSLYGAYMRGESDFADSELIQDTYYLGAGANFHMGDAYLLSTALVSVTNNEVQDTGSAYFTSHAAGVGLEGGYVFDLGEGFKLQPNIFASFTYIHGEAWTTGRGASISDGDFYELRLSPGVRLDKEFSETTTGYAFGRYVHIEVDGTTMTANDIDLPDLSLKPYGEYGIGLSKEWGSLIFFAEGLCRNGGREGWEGQIGFKYTW